MKVAVVVLPRDGDCELVMSGANKRPPFVLMLGRVKLFLIFLIIPIFTAALLASGVYLSRIPVPWMVQSTVTAELGAPGGDNTAPRKASTAVMPLEQGQTLKKGDKVILKGEADAAAGPKVLEVAGVPNDTAVIRKSGAVEQIFVLGPNMYLVTDDADTRIVKAEEIGGTIAMR